MPDRGPIEWVVVDFVEGRFASEIAPQVEDLVERGIVRLLDVIIVKRDVDGTLDVFELSDLDESDVGVLHAYRADLMMLLSDDEVSDVAASVSPGSVAALLVWENAWAAPFGSAVRRAGGGLVARGRLRVQDLHAGRPIRGR